MSQIRLYVQLALILFVAALKAPGADLTWSMRHEDTATPAVLWGIGKGPAGLIACGTNGTLLQSLDGVNWQTRSPGSSTWLLSATYGNGHYIVVGDRGTILSSIDGKTWNLVGSGVTPQRLNRVLFAHNKFVAVGEAETILYSPDGLTWTLENTGGTAWLRALTSPSYDESTEYQEEFWIAAGQNGQSYYSKDGQAWTLKVNPGLLDVETIVFETALSPDIHSEWPSMSYFFAGAGQGGVTFGAWVNFPNIEGVYSGAVNLSLSSSNPQYLTSDGSRLRAYAGSFWSDYIFAGENGIIVRWTYGANIKEEVGPSNRNINDAIFYGNSYFVTGDDSSIYKSNTLGSAKLANISSRGFVSTGQQVMIAGTIVTGPTPKKFLVRGLGPTLADYAVTGVLPDPQLQVFDQKGNQLTKVGAWSKSAGAADVIAALNQLGSPLLDPNRLDSALVVTLPPGGYTFIVSSVSGQSGIALVDVFDLDDTTNTSKLTNVSTRADVGPGPKTLIAGLIIDGTVSKQVLLRGVGPMLSAAGVTSPLADPVITVFDHAGNKIATNDNWGSQTPPTWTSNNPFDHSVTKQEMSTLMASVGVTSLDSSPNEAAIVLKLDPGAYTIQVTGKNGASGTALVETYELPY